MQSTVSTEGWRSQRGAIQGNTGMFTFKPNVPLEFFEQVCTCRWCAVLLKITNLVPLLHIQRTGFIFHPAACYSSTLHASGFISPERKLQSHLLTYIKFYITSFSFVKSSTYFNWINKEQFWEMQIFSWQSGGVNSKQKPWDFSFISEGDSYSFHWDDRSSE